MKRLLLLAISLALFGLFLLIPTKWDKPKEPPPAPTPVEVIQQDHADTSSLLVPEAPTTQIIREIPLVETPKAPEPVANKPKPKKAKHEHGGTIQKRPVLRVPDAKGGLCHL